MRLCTWWTGEPYSHGRWDMLRPPCQPKKVKAVDEDEWMNIYSRHLFIKYMSAFDFKFHRGIGYLNILIVWTNLPPTWHRIALKCIWSKGRFGLSGCWISTFWSIHYTPEQYSTKISFQCAYIEELIMLWSRTVTAWKLQHEFLHIFLLLVHITVFELFIINSWSWYLYSSLC